MTTQIDYHGSLALFESDGIYWIGQYSTNLTHQNGEPPYCFFDGYWNTKEEGIHKLEEIKQKNNFQNSCINSQVPL